MAEKSEVDNDGDIDDEEESKRKEEERNAAEELFEEAEAKARVKSETKDKNLNVSGLRLSDDDLRKLDGSVKKNTAFQRKLRSITEQQRTQLTTELKNLNLSKYIQEVACSIAEAKLKLSDVGCAVHLCCLLHQRYEEFSSSLMDNLQRIYQNPIGKDDEKAAVVTKYRLGLRLTGELVLVGVVEEDVGLSLLQDMLSSLVRSNEVEHPYLAVMVSFARHFAEDIAGITPRKHRMMFTKFKMKPRLAQLIYASKQREFRDQLSTYFKSVSSHLVKEHRAMHKRERKNHQLMVTKGEIPEERQAENDAAQKAYDKLLTSVSTLAEVLDEDMPDLPEYVAPQEESDISIELQFPTLGDSDEADPSALWEDEETRQFYEGITDIKPFVPAILLEERKKTASESTDDEEAKPSEQTEEAVDDDKLLEEMIKEAEEGTGLDEEAEEDVISEEARDTEGDLPSEPPEAEGEVADPSSQGAQFERFGLLLPTMLNRKLVDDLAVEFCMTLNSKGNRKKLAWTLFAVEKNRMDLIPFYARLVATLSPCVDDVVPTLLDMLLGVLRHQIRKKDQLHIHTKLKNIRLLAELTKFGICPKPEAMKIITLLLRNFAHHHVDMACQCLEQCGRFLLRSPDSNLRAKALLEILVRKKTVLHLDPRQKSLVESALYYANPPETPQITFVEEPTMQLYIKKLLYKDLNKMNTEKILKQIRKLDWKDPEIFHFTIRCLTAVWNVKYSNVHCVANLLAGLKTYQEEAVIRVVDAVLEDIRVCLEINLPKLNQRRVSCVKFVGELYNYQHIESNVVFKVLYLMLQFGSNPDGTPTPLDPFDSYFRVRLVCILLETCGQYFDRGSTKRRLDTYLVYFQCYLFSKRQPQPLEVENLVRDTLELLRPHLVLFATPQEAYEAALELERKYKDKIGSDAQAEEEEEEEEEVRDRAQEEDEEEGDEEGEVEDEEDEDGVGTKEDIFEEEAIFKAVPTRIKCQEDDEFVTMFEKMMSEDFHTRKTENLKVPPMDIAVPLHLKGPTRDKAVVQDGGDTKVKFKVMSRKGNKQQLKELMIPLESDLAVGVREVQQQAKIEAFEEVKQRTLDYERRQEEEDYQAMVAEMESHLKPASRKPSAPTHTASNTRSQGYYYSGGGGGGGGGEEGGRRGGYGGYGGRGRGRGGGGRRGGGGGGGGQYHSGGYQGGQDGSHGSRGSYGHQGSGGGGRSATHQGNRQKQTSQWQ